jgi:hypothetical protein
MSVLILGGFAALFVGVLIPLVLLGRYEGDNINTWLLVTLGGLAGYRARDALSGLDRRIASLLEGFAPEIDQSALAETVRAGVHEAFTPPTPIDYHGLVNIDVTDGVDSVISEESAQLQSGKEYQLKIQFHPNEVFADTASFQGITCPIHINGTSEPSSIPFRVLVDFGFARLPAEEREIVAERYVSSKIESFTFNVPELRAVQLGDEAASSIQEATRPRNINVSIYQQNRFCTTCTLNINV